MKTLATILAACLAGCTGQMKCLMAMGSGKQPATQLVSIHGQAHVVSYNKSVPITSASGSWAAFCPQNHRAELIAQRKPKRESEWAAIDADMVQWRRENGWETP